MNKREKALRKTIAFKDMRWLLRSLRDEFQVVVSSGEPRGVVWFERRIKRLDRMLTQVEEKK